MTNKLIEQLYTAGKINYEAKSRLESLLVAAINGEDITNLDEPNSRVEELLLIHALQHADSYIKNINITFTSSDKIKGVIDYVIRNNIRENVFINKTYYVSSQPTYNNQYIVTINNLLTGKIYNGIGTGAGYSVNTLPSNINDIVYELVE